MQKHRDIAQQLDLFHSEPVAPGMVFWHPNGLKLYNNVKRHIQKRYQAEGFLEIATPMFLKKSLWEISGHWDKFHDDMFVGTGHQEEAQYALKPMSCPAHILFFKKQVLSYRSLPYRVFEFGNVHRNEPSGALNGLMRLRQFTQDDAHVLCQWQDCISEIQNFLNRAKQIYSDYGYHELDVRISTQPKSAFGEDSDWRKAEALLATACRDLAINVQYQLGEGAFYGPKIELMLKDHQGRFWQCGTIQLDFNMPKQFNLAYIDEAGERQTPIMLHQAIYGSLERWIGILLETHQGQLPAWVHPQPVAIASIHGQANAYCQMIQTRLASLGIDAILNDQEMRISKKIKQFHQQKTPLVIIAGNNEVLTNQLVMRTLDGQQHRFTIEAAIIELTLRLKQ